MAEEPAENISGGDSGGGRDTQFDPATAGTRAEAVVDALGDLYWQKAYGGQPAFECLVRTILSQNTSDVASQPAHDSLMSRYGTDGEQNVAGQLPTTEVVGLSVDSPSAVAWTEAV